MLIAVIILAWLLMNTWLTLILAQIKKTFFSGWDDLAWLLVYTIANPFFALFVGKITYPVIQFVKKKKKPNDHDDHDLYWADDFVE